jgi:hypothetical protein
MVDAYGRAHKPNFPTCRSIEIQRLRRDYAEMCGDLRESRAQSDRLFGTINDLRARLSAALAENVELRQELAAHMDAALILQEGLAESERRAEVAEKALEYATRPLRSLLAYRYPKETEWRWPFHDDEVAMAYALADAELDAEGGEVES